MTMRRLLYPTIFISFFAAGIAMAFSSMPTQAISNTTPTKNLQVQPALDLPSTSNIAIQMNILMIGVDDVGSNQTRLRSLWLIIVSPTGDPLTFMPIYPQPASLGENAYTNAHNPIVVDARFPESATIIRLLADQNTWWDEVILFDETGMLSMLNIMGGTNAYQTELTGILSTQAAAPTWDDPQTALLFQTALLSQICDNSSSFTSAFSSGQFELPDPQHVKMSHNRIDLLSELYFLNAAIIRFGCQFPAFNYITASE